MRPTLRARVAARRAAAPWSQISSAVTAPHSPLSTGASTGVEIDGRRRRAALKFASGHPAAWSPCRPGRAPEGPPGKFANGQAAAVRGAQRSTRAALSTRGRNSCPPRGGTGGPVTPGVPPHCAWNRAASTLNRSSPPARSPHSLRARPPRGGLSFEAHLPAQQSQAQQDPRLPRPDADARRASSAARPPCSRPEASLRLIWRIRDRASFEALARARRRRAGPITLRFVHDGSSDPARVSYAVGKWAGSAVMRNRTRRRLRAAVAEVGSELVPGGLYLFGADRDADAAPFTVLESSVATLVGEAREIGR